MSLAYVFWHWPARSAGYDRRLAAFHAALGMPGTVAYRLERAPWDGAAPAPYEDWYPVAGWAALGELNERAVSGARRAPHDAVAERADAGTGAVYGLLRAGPDPHAVRFAAWFGKPSGASYEAFGEAIASALGGREAAVWQRQLVLGPAPEYAVLAASPLELPWPAVGTAPVPVTAA